MSSKDNNPYHSPPPVHNTQDYLFNLLAAMPRSQLSSLYRRISSLLKFDVVGSLPTEVALQIFENLPPQTLLTCSLVSHRWKALANDQSLWKSLCFIRGWEWRQPIRPSMLDPSKGSVTVHRGLEADYDDEGMGGSDDEDSADPVNNSEHTPLPNDSGFVSLDGTIPISNSASNSTSRPKLLPHPQPINRTRSHDRHSAPAMLDPTLFLKPNYKLLYRTNLHLLTRFLTSTYRLSVIQTRGQPSNGHMNMIYCLQLYTYPATNHQVLFTGSRDKTIREWNLKTGVVEKVIEGMHTESVLSLCAKNGYLASGGSDRRVVIWDLEKAKVVRTLMDHQDSVLCVRFDDKRLVSCSKDRTVRVYSFPDLELQHVLGPHRAAVNAVSLSGNYVVSGSGDRSMRVWNVETGKLVRTFEDHHIRGIASIDFKPPFIVSGSSDKHIRLIDMNTAQGWSTCPEYDTSSGIAIGGTTSNIIPPGILSTSNSTTSNLSHASTSTTGTTGSSFTSTSILPTTTIATVGGQIINDLRNTIAFTSGVCNTCGTSSFQRIPSDTPDSVPLLPSHALFLQHPSLPSPFPSQFMGSSSSQQHYHWNSSTSFNQHQHHQNQNQNESYTHPQHQHQHQQEYIHRRPRSYHTDLVRSVSLTPDFIITGSYDLSVKVWERSTGVLVADLTGGHTGKIFCVGVDRTKVVSCGEDQRICVWDFGVGIDTSFVRTSF